MALDSRRIQVIDDDRVVEGDYRDIPPWTLILGTDEVGCLRNALLQRIPLRFRLAGYTEAELTAIIHSHAARLNVLLSPQAARRLARASRGIPRRGCHLLQSLHTCLEKTDVAVTKGAVDKHLATLGIDDEELTPSDRDYLTLLARRNTCTSIETISLQLQIDAAMLKKETESFLLKKEFISITSRGRILTDRAKAMLAEKGLA